jgi:hypothetical protein
MEKERTEDFDTMVFLVDTKLFVKEYTYMEGYDDIVESKINKKVYKVAYEGMKVELTELSTTKALENIEKGLENFVEKLKKELVF